MTDEDPIAKSLEEKAADKKKKSTLPTNSEKTNDSIIARNPSTNMISSRAPDSTPSSSSNKDSENCVPNTAYPTLSTSQSSNLSKLNPSSLSLLIPTTTTTSENNNFQQIHIYIRENAIAINNSFYTDKYLESSSQSFKLQGAFPVYIANQSVSDLKEPNHCAVSITSSIIEQLLRIQKCAATAADQATAKEKSLLAKETIVETWRMGAKELCKQLFE